MKRELASGVLTWAAHERRSDRYGTIKLQNEKEETQSFEVPEGEMGTLSAILVEKRESMHIGDLARGIFPSSVDEEQNGSVLVLGEGKLFVDQDGDEFDVGIEPVDGRRSDWLNPWHLYRLHNSLVTLVWETSDEQ